MSFFDPTIIYNARQDAIAAARSRIAQAFASPSNAGPAKSSVGSGSSGTHRFLLQLSDAQAPGTNPAQSGSNSGTPGPIAQVVLDVVPGATINGHAQRIEYVQSSRQGEQQTFGGFHVNEWGLAPGRLQIDCVVIWGNSPTSDIQAFFSLLRLGKQNSLFDTTPPKSLRFIDSYLGLTLAISQKGITLTQDAERQNMGRINIDSVVLYDYDSGFAPPDATSAPSASNSSTVASVLAGLTNLV